MSVRIYFYFLILDYWALDYILESDFDILGSKMGPLVLAKFSEERLRSWRGGILKKPPFETSEDYML